MNPDLEPSLDSTLVRRIVEAALLASNQPLGLTQLQALFPLDQALSNGTIEAALEALQEACAERGVELVEVASGWRYQVRTEVHPWIARLWAERPQRYTRATLETLALIAYRQPITRGEIEQIRGVAVSSNIIKTLEEREWIRVIGHRDVPGKPALWGTTKSFLDHFNLKSLDGLPPLSELRDLAELEPQLWLDADTPDVAPNWPNLPPVTLEDATDVVIAPSIQATAAVGRTGASEALATLPSKPLSDTQGAPDDSVPAPEHIA